MSCHTAFASISTNFVRLCCNFTWRTSMHILFFRPLLNNLRKCIKIVEFTLWRKHFLFHGFLSGFTLKQEIYFFLAFSEVGKENTKFLQHLICIMVLHVKLQHKRTKFVEMEAKAVWQSKLLIFKSVFFLFFNFGSNLKADKKPNWKIICIYKYQLLSKCPIHTKILPPILTHITNINTLW